MRIAALQMVSGQAVAANQQMAADLVAQAAGAGAELLVLPEYWCLLGQRDSDKLALAEDFGQGPLQDFLAQLARQHGVYLVGGTIPLKTASPDRAYNSSLVFDPQGVCIARYDKIHLFSFHKGREAYNEGKSLEAGSQAVAFDLRARAGQLWRVGLSVCYDLRFPELYRQLAADIYLVPSAFTYTTGQAHWELLLRARAVENLAFVAAAAQGGLHSNGRQTWGHAMVVNPWGQVLAQQAQGAGVVLADCDWQALQNWRLQLPALRHRKL
ncbi:MAG: carbon-nitrogen hydrolase family protein [Candidatus Accumulibacter necessarius]|jgi:predicted amidohydrolase|uniref:carbon-nitrogen hydrolase family protein n=1 Tax=Candidatus Accumulibacter necessarius TaxID=2954386 RepID=UPI002FC31E59